jgi:V/A-type H+-transporting ATPase subunit D
MRGINRGRMAKVKLTKNELKKQKDALKRYNRYLPTLMLKKQQLQIEIRRIELQLTERIQSRQSILDDLNSWIEVFGEPVELAKLLEIGAVRKTEGNIAGVDIPLFEGIDISERE